MEGKPVTEQDIGRQLLLETAAYAESSVCRRKLLLHYFGESYDVENCENCDNCKHPKERIECRGVAVNVLTSLDASREGVKAPYLIDFVRGRRTDDIVSHGHDKLSAFGCCADSDVKTLTPVVRHALLAGYINKDIETYGQLFLTEKGRAFIVNPEDFYIVKDFDFHAIESIDSTGGTSALDPVLYHMLKDQRLKSAKKAKVPPYVVFQDSSLAMMATMSEYLWRRGRKGKEIRQTVLRYH